SLSVYHLLQFIPLFRSFLLGIVPRVAHGNRCIDMADIEKRVSKTGKNTYRARVRLKGYPQDTTTFEQLTDAKRWVQQTEVAMREGRYFKSPEARKRTLEQLIDKYKEHKLPLRGDDKETVEPQLDWWKEHLGKYLLLDITPVLIAEYRDKL